MSKIAPFCSIYPATVELHEWMNWKLVPIEEPVFKHYRGIHRLVKIVDRASSGTLPKAAAQMAIDDWNEDNGTSISFKEIENLEDPSGILYDLGQWAAYVDNLDAQKKILQGDYSDPREAFEYADPSIQWIVVLLPSDGVVVVYRSPYTNYREYYDPECRLSNGLRRGDLLSYTLPPQLEASLGRNDPNEILNPYEQENLHARSC